MEGLMQFCQGFKWRRGLNSETRLKLSWGELENNRAWFWANTVNRFSYTIKHNWQTCNTDMLYYRSGNNSKVMLLKVNKRVFNRNFQKTVNAEVKYLMSHYLRKIWEFFRKRKFTIYYYYFKLMVSMNSR